ncbi:selenocysteine-specific translation elongation factor [Desulfuromonas versatilis]|uniref:Selenocysteine-specific elongation factor n=1 Tax=Desulfuromonas versatilis TaxID=2802975 RepID=A0ABM8HQB1_9BACT|nr:selenocysteine-specific translation elongation factor [Desulfuromonas versatilis]BCR03978.1 selenocysteine-specific translation elongation factor [Desulfuromonas versatilis]
MNKLQQRFVILGTAGHVDHGKTELIRALTGQETDRLKEEKERGISIDLGFASFRLPSGQVAGVVDVPGHERFIHNMLAGIGGIDLVLLVVDVGEGVMPQTHEHLQILQLLEVQRGIVVLTKCDLAEEDWIDIVEEEIREEVAETFLKEAPFCRVSSLTGAGIPELVKTIQTELAGLTPKDAEGPMRLPVDRHFSVSGFGTVVTGTLLSGSVSTGDTVEVLPPGEQVRVREVQVHGKKVEQAFAGQRVAVNLAALDRARLQRGSVVGTPGIFEQTERLDARLSLLPEAPRPLKFRDPVHFYLGTARVVGIVALLDRDELKPGESAIVQIHLDRPLVAHRQDRFIVRSYSPMTTIGGGMVIDPRPVKHRRFRQEVMAALAELESGEKSFLLQKLADQECTRLKDLEVASGIGRERIEKHLEELRAEARIDLLADQWASAESIRAWRRRLVEETGRFHAVHPLDPGIPHATLKGALPAKLSPKAFDTLLEAAVADGELLKHGESVKQPDFAPTPSAEQARLIELIESAYLEAGPQAKNRQEMLDRLNLPAGRIDDCFAFLFGSGRLIKLNEESFLHAETYQAALAALRSHFAANETLTLAQFRDLIGSARKQVQALLEYWDGLKYTMRRGDERVAWKLPKGSDE